MDLYVLEPELLERLKQALAALEPAVHVLVAADLVDVKEEKQLTPAVHLIYGGHRVMQTRPERGLVRIRQTWMAVIATRNTRGLKTGAAARVEAGRLSGGVITALLGWQPRSATQPLDLVDGPKPGFSAGFQYLPLAFSTEVILKPSTP